MPAARWRACASLDAAPLDSEAPQSRSQRQLLTPLSRPVLLVLALARPRYLLYSCAAAAAAFRVASRLSPLWSLAGALCSMLCARLTPSSLVLVLMAGGRDGARF